jgi:pyruvate dehydrogenase E2 component (dihydrolipoamide acetyltransferase)
MGRVAIKTLGGEGPDIVLIHGFGSDRLSWLGNSPALMAFGKVHAIDLPAHGESDADAGSGTPSELAQRVHEVLRAGQIKAPHVFGHSLGGGLALLLAEGDPTLVASLVLIAPIGLGRGIDHAFLETFPKITDTEQAMTLLRRLVVRPDLINRLTVQRTLAQLNRSGVRTALSTIAKQVITHEPRFGAAAAQVSAHGVPRLVLWGAEDRINPPDDNRLADFAGESRLIADCGHLPHIEAAVSVNAALTRFLRQFAAS